MKETLLQEHSKMQMLKIVAYVGNDKKIFSELITLMLAADYRVAQRAAWPVSYCVQKNPTLIKPWFGKLIKHLETENIHDAVKRNTLRIFQEADIPEKYCGKLYGCCDAFLHSLEEPIAVRAFALTVLQHIKKVSRIKTRSVV